ADLLGPLEAAREHPTPQPDRALVLRGVPPLSRRLLVSDRRHAAREEDPRHRMGQALRAIRPDGDHRDVRGGRAQGGISIGSSAEYASGPYKPTTCRTA